MANNKTVEMISEFKGYNRRYVIGDNEFADMQNCVSDYYPVFSSGCSWGAMGLGYGSVTNDKYTKLFADKTNNKLMAICQSETGNKIIYNGSVKGTITGAINSIVMIGSKICMFPAAVEYDTLNDTLTDYNLSWNNTDGIGKAWVGNFTLCDKDGNDITPYVSPDRPPEIQYWLDTSSKPYKLKKFNYDTYSYSEVSPTYVKYTKHPNSPNIPAYKIGDAISISGCVIEELNKNANIITAISDDYFVVEGMIGENTEQNGWMFISRAIPKMDIVIEKGNRLWGCSRDGREIYACKLGDPSVWYDYSGLSTDSYAATIGSGGPFTGAVVFNGYIWFFKRDRVYKIYDSNFPAVQIIEMPIEGVAEGNQNSLVVIDGVLYYKSETAIMAFTGDNVYRISDAFGDDFKKYNYGEAGELDGKYYINLKDTTISDPLNAYTTFVYDTRRKMWHKEDIGIESAEG